MDVFAFLGLSVFGLLIAGGIFALLAKWKHKSWLLWGIIGAVLALIPFIGWILWIVCLLSLLFGLSGDSGSENSSDAREFGQGAPYAYIGGNTGIAVNTEKRIVRLKEGKSIKEYAFTAIREWRTNLSSGGEVFSAGGIGLAGMHAGIAAAGHNARNARRNRKESGLFISVRDIDRPEWRIDMPNEKNQKRWMEILRQAIHND